jgi:chromate reductase, NAD(P)H dehydrogenase (quinone)
VADDSAPRILALAGSLRKGSLNRRLLRYAIAGAVEAGGRVEELGPDALELPLYNGDLESDGRYPLDVEAWRERIRACDGLLIASPEYNHGLSGVLKNAIDWGSRPPNVLTGKVAASFGTTSGPYGSARSQMSLRLSLTPLNVWVVPKTVLIPHGGQAFDETGELKDARLVQELAAVGRILVRAVQAGLGRIT